MCKLYAHIQDRIYLVASPTKDLHKNGLIPVEVIRLMSNNMFYMIIDGKIQYESKDLTNWVLTTKTIL